MENIDRSHNRLKPTISVRENEQRNVINHDNSVMTSRGTQKLISIHIVALCKQVASTLRFCH